MDAKLLNLSITMSAYHIKHTLLALLILLLFHANALASCVCDTNCPSTMLPVGTFSSSITVSGATNNTLGQNGQRLIGVNMSFNHDAVNELDVILVAPDGSSVELMSNYSLEWNLDQDFDICFVACDMVAQPDPGFPAVIDTWQMSQAGAGYSFEGSYYPSVGCLEDLTGSVNGTWTLEMEDHVVVMGGTLFEWSLVFEDNDGTMCPEPCEPPIYCQADGGEVSGVDGIYCESSPDLLLDPTVTHSNSPPNPNEYGYTFVITDENGVILEYNDFPDLTTYSPGTYELCGLSYLIEDLGNIPPPDGVYTRSDLQSDIDNEVFCADLSDDCETIEIEPQLEPININGPEEVCPDELVSYTIENLNLSADFNIVINGAFSDLSITSDTILNIIWEDEPGPRSICADHSNACGTESFCLEIEVFEFPDIDIFGPQELCPGETGVYEFFPPPGPGEFYDIDIVGGLIVNQGSAHVEVEWYENNFQNYLTVEVIGADCPHPEPETFDVLLIEYDLPDFFDYSSEFCTGDAGWAEMDPHPHIQTYSWYGDSITIEQGQGTSGPIVFSVDEPGTTMLCVELDATCGLEGPICQEVTVLEIPNPDIGPIDPQCQLEFTLSSTFEHGNFGSWEQTGGPSIATIQNPFDAETDVEVFEPGTYYFEFTEDNGYCLGSNLVEIIILPGLDIDLVTHQCIFDEYFVIIEISGGEPPYSVNGEEIAGNIFESDFRPEGEDYSFLISDVSGCTAEVTGTHECPCQIDPGSMSPDPIEICIDSGEEFAGIYNNDGTMGPNDIGAYILHDNPGPIPGTIFDMNQSGVFTLQPGMEAGEVYYISHVIGPEENGSVDLGAECVAVALGQAVEVFGLPDFEVPSDAGFCLGSVEIVIDNADPSGVLEIYDHQGGAEPDWADMGDGLYQIQPSEPGVTHYQYTGHNGPCTRSDSFTLEFYELPFFASWEILCAGNEFNAHLEISGGSPPYFLNGTELASDTYLTDTFPGGTELTFTLTDGNNCEADTLVILGDCQCISRAGQIDTSEITLCLEDKLIPSELTIRDTVLEEGDSLYFVLHRGPAEELGEILKISKGEPMPIPPGVEPWEEVFLSLVTGVADGDLTFIPDPCFENSEGIPVVWQEGPVVTIGGENQVCEGDSVDFVITSEGPLPQAVELASNQGRNYLAEITGAEYRVILSAEIEGEEIWEIVEVTSDCPATFSGEFSIETSREAEIIIDSPPTPICNNAIFGSTINLDSLLSGEVITGQWLNNTGDPVDPNLDFDGLDSGDYVFLFSTEGFEGPCPGQLLETTITVEHCECPEVIAVDSVGLCAEEYLYLPELIQTEESGQWTISQNDLSGPTPFLEGDFLVLDQQNSGYLTLTFSLTDSFPQECTQEFDVVVYADYARHAGTATFDGDLCEGVNQTISLNDQLTGHQAGGNWQFEGQIISTEFETGDLPPGSHSLFYVLDAGEYCSGDTTELTIEVNPSPQFEVDFDHPACFGENNGHISIQLEGEFNGNETYIFEGQNRDHSEFGALPAGVYEVNVISAQGCEGIPQSVELENPEEITVDLGEGLTANFSDEIRIALSSNASPEEILNIEWTLNGQVLETDKTELTFTLERTSTVAVHITTEKGCEAQDEMIVQMRDPSVYIPNVFRPGSGIQSNSVFGPMGTETVEEIIIFRIFDRWGNKLYEVENISPEHGLHFWDGSSDGEALNPGVYVFHLSYLDVTGQVHTKSGEFSLLR